MIESVMHVIGVCPDTMAHFDVIDFVGYNWIYTVDTFNFYYRKIKLLF